MQYDIEGAWHLLDTCNFRCSYCFFSAKELGRKIAVRALPEEWLSAFTQTGKRWLLHLTGGEPPIYPGFAKDERTFDLTLVRHLALTSRCLWMLSEPPLRLDFFQTFSLGLRHQEIRKEPRPDAN